ncbi:hemagglutinin-related protein [Pandoraea terrae]|uniref:Hemagglutinin-related protein n=1 Tax=Pandoraea terrae TaxID=1537710 RepID=A0A5E4ZE75_9BURK|nr:hypothetical protein [Pandoraea terrae]VVE59599.1 hemagglutinin-related protein [Pandoraea terrae]
MNASEATVGKIFNEEEIRAGFEIVEPLQREVGVFVNHRAREAGALGKARDAEQDPAIRAQLDAQLTEAQKWGPGRESRHADQANGLPADDTRGRYFNNLPRHVHANLGLASPNRAARVRRDAP